MKKLMLSIAFLVFTAIVSSFFIISIFYEVARCLAVHGREILVNSWSAIADNYEVTIETIKFKALMVSNDKHRAERILMYHDWLELRSKGRGSKSFKAYASNDIFRKSDFLDSMRSSRKANSI